MKIAIITDQHFGARKNSKLFHDYFLEFYDKIFFPKLEELGITCVIDMGDTFDNRTGINFSALSWAKSNYYDRLQKMGVTVWTLVGNHTAYYKNTNSINAVDLLLREYDNVRVISEYTEVCIDGLGISFIPWINSENEDVTYSSIKKSKSTVAMGHLELKGFAANKQCIMDHGADKSIYKNFTKVFSGHYHTRSVQDNVFYLGNPYEIYWNDVDDVRGFHIFDTDTLETTPINNPYKIFHKVYYEDTPYQLFDTSPYEDKIVKVIVKKKSDPKNFERFVDKFYTSNVSDLKIVENFDFNGWYSGNSDQELVESENTLSILHRYIDDSDTTIDKSKIKDLIGEVYKEACEVVD